MKLIERNNYLDELINVIGIPDIKVITGIRRCGKSKLLEEFKEYVTKTDKDANIIHINYNLHKFNGLKKCDLLIDYVEKKYVKNKNNFIMIDEVQMCEDFEVAINNFHAEEKYDIYITGSNAFLMSSDLATLFTGRTFKIEVYPFSFKEYVEYYKIKDINDGFDKYVKEGGMSGAYLYKNDEEKYQYIKEVFNTLIIRDIKDKYKIRNTNIIENLANYLIDNISNLTSANNIASDLNANNVSITDKTITKYISYLCKFMLEFFIKRKLILLLKNKMKKYIFKYLMIFLMNLLLKGKYLRF